MVSMKGEERGLSKRQFNKNALPKEKKRWLKNQTSEMPKYETSQGSFFKYFFRF